MAHKQWETNIGRRYIDHGPDVLIQIGKDSLTYTEFAQTAEKYNFPAVRNLEMALAKFKPKPKSVKDAAKRTDQFQLMAKGNIGDTAIMVWCHIMEMHGVNVNQWLGKGVRGKRNMRKGRKR